VSDDLCQSCGESESWITHEHVCRAAASPVPPSAREERKSEVMERIDRLTTESEPSAAQEEAPSECFSDVGEQHCPSCPKHRAAAPVEGAIPTGPLDENESDPLLLWKRIAELERDASDKQKWYDTAVQQKLRLNVLESENARLFEICKGRCGMCRALASLSPTTGETEGES
jgi:hypothetical protein